MNPWLQLVAGNLLLACLIGALAWRVGSSGRRAMLAHLLWVAFFVKLITPPIVLLPVTVPVAWLPTPGIVYPVPSFYSGLETRAQQASKLTSFREIRRSYTVAPAVTSEANRWSWSFGWWTCLGCLWMLGVMICLSRGAIRFIRFSRLLAREGQPDDEATAIVEQLAKRSSRHRRAPIVLRIPIRVSPMLLGFGSRAVIVCPDQLWRSLSDRDRQAFLAHETAHFCRRDHWVRWLEWIVTAAYWWFPGVYVARRQLERHEEACCDAWVIRELGCPPRQYAEALLHVVDFVSEQRSGLPRLASGMQPTDSLEERLRLMMRRPSVETESPLGTWLAGSLCFTLWLVHPVAMPAQPRMSEQQPSLVVSPRSMSGRAMTPQRMTPEMRDLIAVSEERQLPAPPQGYWTRRPRSTWANFTLKLSGAKLLADVSRGITIELPEQRRLEFSPEELTALAEVPETGRVVMGDQSGQIRLWDLDAGMPVSLIGQHVSAITSIAYHPTAGIVSADSGGSVMRWDLQSGRVLATWIGKSTSVQSVRFSKDGATLAILSGHWSQSGEDQQVQIVETASLSPLWEARLPRNAAVTLPFGDDQWVTVDWSGQAHSVRSDALVYTLDKNVASALSFCQSSMPLASYLPSQDTD